MELRYSNSDQKIRRELRGRLAKSVPAHAPVPSDTRPVKKHNEAIADIIDDSPSGQFDGE